MIVVDMLSIMCVIDFLTVVVVNLHMIVGKDVLLHDANILVTTNILVTSLTSFHQSVCKLRTSLINHFNTENPYKN